jgi:hypothetical protein
MSQMFATGPAQLLPSAMAESAAWFGDEETTQRSEDGSESPANARERRLHGFLSTESGSTRGGKFALRPPKASGIGAVRVRHLTRMLIGTTIAPAPTQGCNADTAIVNADAVSHCRFCSASAVTSATDPIQTASGAWPLPCARGRGPSLQSASGDVRAL